MPRLKNGLWKKLIVAMIQVYAAFILTSVLFVTTDTSTIGGALTNIAMAAKEAAAAALAGRLASNHGSLAGGISCSALL